MCVCCLAGSDRGCSRFVLAEELVVVWKTSMAFPLCVAQFCQEPPDDRPHKMQLVSVNAGVGVPEDVTSIRVERGGI